MDPAEAEGMNREQLNSSVYLAGQVRRYHTFPTLQKPTVAQHCWRVATLYIELWGLPSAEVLQYCLHHDSGELWAGDLPFGAKSRNPDLKEAMNGAEEDGLKMLHVELPRLNSLELRRVKLCDLLEMYEFGVHELRMGNSYATLVVNDTWSAALRLATLKEYETLLNWRTENEYQ
jgi:5'-deoxynucleotidase YfbR-like HD superfamily hydrolase